MSVAKLRAAAFFSSFLALCSGAPQALAQAGAAPPGAQGGKGERAKQPVFLSAERIEGSGDRRMSAEGNVQLRSADLLIRAERLSVDNETGEVQARGAVRVEKEGSVLSGGALRFNTDTQTGQLEQPEFSLSPRIRRGGAPITGRGQADRVDIEGEDRYHLINTTFTTCRPGNDDWYLRVEDLNLDYGREVGTARWVTLHFLGAPILATPYLDFGLSNQRKSGFLAPTIGTTGRNGPELSLPYYFNLAPNRDLTVTPRYMAKRGLLLGGEFRYLESAYRGIAKLELLPQDQVRGGTRSAASLVHTYQDGPLAAALNLNKVSDNDYFRDLSSRVASVSQVYLPREGGVTYTGRWWDGGQWTASGRIQTFQTLQDPNNIVPTPYSRAPQVLLSASRPDIRGFDFAFSGEAVDFHHPSQAVGARITLNPSLALPLLSAGAFITPKLGLHVTSYRLSQTAPGTPASQQRMLPVFSTDAGMIFERDARIAGESLVQTLEPRAYYVRIPYRDQSAIPLFDTAQADFNYAQIFSENSFVGGDRVNDANQLTLALTSRLLSAASGQESLRATVAQRFYRGPQKVTLNAATPPRDFIESDWLASVGGRLARAWTLESSIQYNPRDTRAERLTVATRYQPEALKTLNLSYRFLRNQFTQVDVSGQWPLGGSWYGVGRYNYSLKDNRVVEALGGIEYNGDCWIGRVVVQRFAAAATVATNAVFVQLELNGLARIGSNPLEALKRNIPGYTRLNQSEVERPF